MILIKITPYIIIVITILCLLIISNNLLISLLILEIIVLRLVFISILYNRFICSDNIITILIILTLGACEASLGLSCLVKISRTYGNDSLNNKSLNIC